MGLIPMAVLTRSVFNTVALMGQRLHQGGFGLGFGSGGVLVVCGSMGLRLWEGLLKWGQRR